MARKVINYVNNKRLLAEFVIYKAQVKEAEEKGLEKPRLSPYIGECILEISKRLSKKTNFCNYPFVEDMIGDGVSNAIEYIDNFNPEKYNNPFGYLTKIIYYAFIRRIQKEKKYLYTKFKTTENANIFGEVSTRHEHQHQNIAYKDMIEQSDGTEEYISDFIRSFEAARDEKKRMKAIKDEERKRESNNSTTSPSVAKKSK